MVSRAIIREASEWTTSTYLQYDFDLGLYLRLAFETYDYDEDNPLAGDPASPTPDVNDYDADLWTFYVGYRF